MAGKIGKAWIVVRNEAELCNCPHNQIPTALIGWMPCARCMLWMTVFHFCFDLNHFGLMPRQNFYADAFWTRQRTVIVSLFLFTAGFQPSCVAGAGLAVCGLASALGCTLLAALVAGSGLCAAGVVGLGADVSQQFHLLWGAARLAVMLLIARLTAGWGKWLWLADWANPLL